MDSQLSFGSSSLDASPAQHGGTIGHGHGHGHGHTSSSSAAEPIALALLALGVLFLLQAFLRSFLPHRIALPSADYQPLPTSDEHGGASTEEEERAEDPHLPSAVAAQPILPSDYEQEEEKKLAEAAIGKAVDLDDFRVRSRSKLAALAFFATVNLAIGAGQLAWIVGADHRVDWKDRVVEGVLRSGLNTLIILVIFRRNSISAWNLAVSLTTACFINFVTQLLVLLVPPGFAIFPEVSSRLSDGDVPSAAVGFFLAPAQRLSGSASHLLHNAATRAIVPTQWLLQTVSQNVPPALTQVAHDVSQSRVLFFLINALSLLSALLAVWFAGTIPIAPQRVYQPLASSQPTRMLAQGALGGDSILVRLTHFFMVPIVFFAKRNGGLDADDVPYLHAELRSIVLFLGIRKIWRTKREEKGGKTSPLMLLGCFIYANRRPILWSLPFSWICATLFYAPSFAINRFIAVFERQEAAGGQPRDVRSGIVWAVTIFAVSATQNILLGMLLMNFWSTMRSSLKQQITTLLFSKALKRQDISGSAPAEAKKDPSDVQPANGEQGTDDDEAKKKKKGKKGKKEDEEEEKPFASKAAVMTLISNDCERVVKIAEYTLTLTILPFEVIVGFSYVYVLLGWGAFVGLATILIFAPIIALIGKLNGRFQEHLMKARDKRVTFLNEAIEAIRMIKFSAWERKIMDRILLSRRRELQELRKVFYCEILNEAVVDFSPSAIIIVAFLWAMLVEKRKITPSVAFTSVAVLNELRFALTELPSIVQALIELWVSLKRISAFLDLPEVEPPKTVAPQPAFEGAPKVELRGATISWPVHAEPETKKKQVTASNGTADGSATATSALTFKLQDISVKFEPGKVNLICGKVGSGKSMLLLGLLGELSVESGTIDSPRSHPNALGGMMTAAFVSPNEWLRSDLNAYVPQTAWLTNASLRDNILWGLPMNEKRYQDTLFACGLLPDLEILEDGDLTDIGEQGIGLSGGQKTRVSLARATYSRASLILMDSPLSNVDAHTAKHIQEHLLDGPLLANRTVLLVTHLIAISAPNAAKVVLLDDGKITFDGPTEDFLHSDFYSGLLEDKEEESELATPAQSSAPESTASPTQSGAATPEDSQRSAATTPATSRAPSPTHDEDEEDSKPAKEIVIREARKMISEEARKRGAVGWSTYEAWINAAGGRTAFILMLLAFAVFNGWALLSNFWLRGLSQDAGRSQPTHSPLYWVIGYAGLLSAASILRAVAFLSLYLLSLRASSNLFAKMLDSVFRAKLRTHDTIPKGRFLNRFSSDMESNDQLLPLFFAMFCCASGSFIVGLIAVFLAGGHQFVWMLVILAPVYLFTAQLYRIVTRDLRRLEAASKSPLTTSFSDLLSGSVVVRAFGSSGRMMSNLLAKSDESARFMWLLSETSRLTILVIQFCSALLVLAANISILLNPRIDSATAGFATSFLVTTDFLLMFSLLTFSNLEQKAVSTERIVEYQELPQEPPALVSSGPPPGWPHTGAIEIRDLEIKYAPELPSILQGISLTIPPAAKIGILGRTGSGKSTLASSFFRFVDPTRGQILIDDVDLSSLGLEQLRSKLTIVPQDPVILSGTLREALDPFQEHSDEEVTAALKRAYLIPADEAQAKKSNFSDLSYAIAEGGSNLSGGQRQLLCLGRALLQKSRVVFFDEASSALDSETDASIAAAIRDAFRESTVLTIAHRLRTVADFDYILVLHDGQVAEFDKPIRLIDNPTSRYHKLCKASGRAEFRHLRAMAIKRAA